MAQVLTSEGLAEYHATGKVPEFVKPGDDKPVEAKAVTPEPVKAESTPAASEADDETEDEQGLTAAERKAYSEKIAKKISAKHRALKQAEAQAAREGKGRQAAEKEASDLRAEIESLKKVTVDDGKGPKRADFENDADWWDAKIEWKAEQKAEQKFTALEAKRENERLEAIRVERIQAFADTVDDYDETVDALADVKQWDAVIDYMKRAEMGPDLIYWYGKHPDEYEKLLKMKPIDAVAEVGKRETKLERKAAKAEKETAEPDALESFKAPISRAPAPIQAISDNAASVQKDPSKMSFDELRAYNREQRLKQAR